MSDPTPPKPSFTSCPPIFVLSTHLTLEELHEVEENLIRRGASLTYDASEARLVLGRIAQKKRAALELRGHGVWTEEVAAVGPPAGIMGGEKPPPVKRRRVDGHQDGDVSQSQSVVIDLTAEEGEEKDQRFSSPDGVSVAYAPSVASTVSSDGAVDIIKVVNLEWLDKSLASGQLLPVDPFVVYQARIMGRPPEITSTTIEPSREEKVVAASQILERAKADAAIQPPATAPSNRFLSRRTNLKEPHDGTRQPPKLYRQTTSEHEEAIPIPPAPDWVKDNVKYACMRSAPLHPPNEKFITQLQKIRRIRELTVDEIGVRAYSTSIAAIAAYPYEIRMVKEILSLPGCDMKIANLFVEFKDSPEGTLSAAEALDTDPALKVLNEFYNIWGVGAKTARDFYYLRHWRDLDDIVEQGWHTLSRVQQIGVKYYDEFLAGISRAEVEDIAKTVHRHANLVRPDSSSNDGQGIDCVIVGGYRRGKEICGDVDLVLSHRDETVTKNLVVDIVSSLEQEGWITHTLALHMTNSNREQQPLPFRGDDSGKHFDTLDKALVVWQDPHFEQPSQLQEEEEGGGGGGEGKDHENHHPQKRNPNPHRRVDIIISPWRTVGCAVLGWSGDTTFERDLRRYARKMHGWKFDSSGVRERSSGGQVIDLEYGGRTWEERERLVMEGLGVGWRDARERCSR